MKKKFFMSVLAMGVVALATFTSYKSWCSKATTANIILDANIEALTAGDVSDGGYNVFHLKYINPTTGLETGKCTATSCYAPNGKCPTAHNHSAKSCCSHKC